MLTNVYCDNEKCVYCKTDIEYGPDFYICKREHVSLSGRYGFGDDDMLFCSNYESEDDDEL